MVSNGFASMIKLYIHRNLGNILREAEATFEGTSGEGSDPRPKDTRIIELAESILVSRLVDIKGDCLTWTEVQYTSDLFRALSRWYDSSNGIGYETRIRLEAFRVELEKAAEGTLSIDIVQ